MTRAVALIDGEHYAPVVRDALGALKLELSAEELTQIAEAVPASEVAGTRYDERQMQWLDSEK